MKKKITWIVEQMKINAFLLFYLIFFFFFFHLFAPGCRPTLSTLELLPAPCNPYHMSRQLRVVFACVCNGHNHRLHFPCLLCRVGRYALLMHVTARRGGGGRSGVIFCTIHTSMGFFSKGQSYSHLVTILPTCMHLILVFTYLQELMTRRYLAVRRTSQALGLRLTSRETFLHVQLCNLYTHKLYALFALGQSTGGVGRSAPTK